MAATADGAAASGGGGGGAVAMGDGVGAAVGALGGVAAATGGDEVCDGAFGASSGGRMTQAPVPAAAASMIANDVITTGRFSRGRFGEAAGLPVIPGE